MDEELTFWFEPSLPTQKKNPLKSTLKRLCQKRLVFRSKAMSYSSVHLSPSRYKTEETPKMTLAESKTSSETLHSEAQPPEYMKKQTPTKNATTNK